MIIKIKNKLLSEKFVENKSVTSVAICRNPRKGFTLIEFLLYTAVLGIILVATVSAMFEFVRIKTSAASMREIEDNSRFIADVLRRTIEESAHIVSPAPGFSSSTLALQTTATKSPLAKNPITIERAGFHLTVRRGTATNPAEKLTSDFVIAKSITFTNTSSFAEPGSIRVDIRLETIYPIERSEYRSVSTSTFTASVRAKDTDGDTFSDGAEVFIGTDPGARCPRDSGHAAWPPDLDNDGVITLLGDTAPFTLRYNVALDSREGESTYDRRIDLNADGFITSEDESIFSQYSLDMNCNTIF